MQTIFNFLYKQWFVCAILMCIVIGSLFPDLGASGGILHTDFISDWGIIAIFFIQGASLPTQVLKAGIVNIKLHLAVQSSIFLFFPALYIIFNFFFGGYLNEHLNTGFMFLCALPCTISYCTVLTSMAKGNVMASIFNAALANIIGIIITPSIVGIFLEVSNSQFEFMPAVINISKLILLPFVIGQLSRLIIKDYVQQNKKYFVVVEKAVPLIIVLAAFSDSTKGGIWSNNSPSIILIALIGSLILLIIGLLYTVSLAKALKLNYQDTTTLIFCGSQKTLIAGMPMAKLIFSPTSLGLVILPIMFYYQLQLIIDAVIANRMKPC